MWELYGKFHQTQKAVVEREAFFLDGQLVYEAEQEAEKDEQKRTESICRAAYKGLSTQEYQQADVKVYEVNKRNGIIQDGLVVRQKGVAVSPMLYLDAYDYSYPETALKKTARDYVDIVANGQNLIEMLVEK